jgi:hypothetical protein
VTRCKSCGAELLWTLTERGRKMPLDVDPYTGDDPRGLFVLRRQTELAPTAVAVPLDAFPGEPVYRSHFASCPNADRHRRRGL